MLHMYQRNQIDDIIWRLMLSHLIKHQGVKITTHIQDLQWLRIELSLPFLVCSRLWSA